LVREALGAAAGSLSFQTRLLAAPQPTLGAMEAVSEKKPLSLDAHAGIVSAALRRQIASRRSRAPNVIPQAVALQASGDQHAYDHWRITSAPFR
jgi:hypothetical protein